MTRKLALSALVIGSVVTAVGLITFALSSESVTSNLSSFTAGTLDIRVDGYDEFFETFLDMPNVEPGDCSYDQVTVTNVGTMAVNLWNWIYTWGDIFGCDPNPACNLTVNKTLAGDSDAIPEYIEPGGYETYDLAACLPLCAGNKCQGDSGTMRLFFHAVQAANLDGYECVKLEDKRAPDWIPDPVTPAHGNLCYKVVDDQSGDSVQDLHVVIDAYGLTAAACFQLSLDGGDMNDPNDGACTAQDANLAGMASPPDTYVSGYWNWGTFLEPTCNPVNGGEGVWNFAGVYQPGAICADASGDFSWSGTLTGLPAGSYIVKQSVKEISNPWPGDSWAGVLSGLAYLQFTLQ